MDRAVDMALIMQNPVQSMSDMEEWGWQTPEEQSSAFDEAAFDEAALLRAWSRQCEDKEDRSWDELDAAVDAASDVALDAAVDRVGYAAVDIAVAMEESHKSVLDMEECGTRPFETQMSEKDNVSEPFPDIPLSWTWTEDRESSPMDDRFRNEDDVAVGSYEQPGSHVPVYQSIFGDGMPSLAKRESSPTMEEFKAEIATAMETCEQPMIYAPVYESIFGDLVSSPAEVKSPPMDERPRSEEDVAMNIAEQESRDFEETWWAMDWRSLIIFDNAQPNNYKQNELFVLPLRPRYANQLAWSLVIERRRKLDADFGSVPDPSWSATEKPKTGESEHALQGSRTNKRGREGEHGMNVDDGDVDDMSLKRLCL